VGGWGEEKLPEKVMFSWDHSHLDSDEGVGLVGCGRAESSGQRQRSIQTLRQDSA
jgi:hypothetical protein